MACHCLIFSKKFLTDHKHNNNGRKIQVRPQWLLWQGVPGPPLHQAGEPQRGGHPLHCPRHHHPRGPQHLRQGAAGEHRRGPGVWLAVSRRDHQRQSPEPCGHEEWHHSGDCPGAGVHREEASSGAPGQCQWVVQSGLRHLVNISSDFVHSLSLGGTIMQCSNGEWAWPLRSWASGWRRELLTVTVSLLRAMKSCPGCSLLSYLVMAAQSTFQTKFSLCSHD